MSTYMKEQNDASLQNSIFNLLLVLGVGCKETLKRNLERLNFLVIGGKPSIKRWGKFFSSLTLNNNDDRRSVLHDCWFVTPFSITNLFTIPQCPPQGWRQRVLQMWVIHDQNLAEGETRLPLLATSSIPLSRLLL